MTSNSRTARHRLAAAAAALAVALTLSCARTAAADRHALLIGIDDYESSNFGPLSGSLNDVELMRGVLEKYLAFPAENIATLVNSQATATGVVAAMEDLAERIAPGDMVYVQYSGHGSTTCDLNGDDYPRAFDSTLVTFGSRSGVNPLRPASCQGPPSGSEALAAAEREADEAKKDPDSYDLIDDRVNRLVAGLRTKADLVIFVSDSCFSGTIARGDPARTRGVPMDARVNPDAFLTGPAGSGQGRGPGRTTVLMGSQAGIDALDPEAATAGPQGTPAPQDPAAQGTQAPQAAGTQAPQAAGTQAQPTAAAGTQAETGAGPRRALGDYIAIGTADQYEGAKEFEVEKGKSHGVFTWFFAKSIQNARPEDTWQQVVDRAKAYMNGVKHGDQHQVVEGNPDRLVFEGVAGGGLPAYLVTQSFESGGKSVAEVDVGLLANVGPGTVFVKARPGVRPPVPGEPVRDQDVAARLTVTRSGDLTSFGEVTQGAFENGDTVYIQAWQQPGQPYRIRYHADLPEDRELIPLAREVFRGLSMVEEVADSGPDGGGGADIVCWIVRPGGRMPSAPQADGSPGPFVPPPDPSAPPEIWLVSPAEDSFLWGFENLRVRLDGNGPEMLRENFKRASRAHHLLTMEGPAGARPRVTVSYLLLRQPGPDEWDRRSDAERFEFESPDGTLSRWVISREVASDFPLEQTAPGEKAVMLKAVNNTGLLYHVYGFNVTPNGQIVCFLPNDKDKTRTELPGNMTVVFRDFSLGLDEPGEFVRVIVTGQPLRVSDMEQMELDRFTENVTRGKPLDTLNSMMAEMMTLSRLAPGMSAAGAANQWFTTSMTFGE
ncbi:MAG: caspase family protein [Deltaproteobacteria bacterium]|jgi:hypothetical protein|nr:caspase family protein [Deltaproteobacteria bacterium]